MKAERAKRKIKVAESRRFVSLRDMLESKMGKAPSNEVVSHNVNIDPDICTLYDEYYDLQETADALDSARFALYARREILIQMGAETRLDRKQNH